MITETCSKCHNTVVGEFTPGETRKWLTALAKKGGMKAVLTAAGSVIPGFGNAVGFLAGTALDVIYGKDINKLIDKIADEFDDNKVYVFTCPQCGHTWSRKEDDLVDQDTQRIDVGLFVSGATALKALLAQAQLLTEAEQEYLDEYRECLAEGGSISSGERRLLNRLRVKLGISEERAAELEGLNRMDNTTEVVIS